MEILLTVFFAILSITSFVTSVKQNENYYNFIFYLFYISAIVIVLNKIGNLSTQQYFLTYFIGIYTSIWLITSLFKNKYIFIFPFVFALSFLLWNGTTYTFNSYLYKIEVSNILFLPIFFTSFIYFIDLIIEKVNLISDKYHFLIHSFVLVFFGVIANFLAGLFAVFLIVFMYLLYSNVKKISFNKEISILFIVFFILFVSEVHVENILHPSSFLAVVLSFSIAGIIFKFHKEKIKLRTSLILYFTLLFFVFFLSYLDNIKEHIAGISFLVIFILLFTFNFSYKYYKFKIFYAFIFAFLSIFFILFPKSENILTQINENDIDVEDIWKDTNLISNVSTDKTISNNFINDSLKKVVVTNPFYGEWKVNSKKSIINFELGPPDARTKGAFNQINGSLFYSDTVSNIKLKINLPLEGFTTNNTFRDETLMEKEFLDYSTQAVLTFESTDIIKIGNKFKVNGIFSMRGVKKKLPIEIKLSKLKNNTIVLIGNAKLDRTEYGMSSDSKIGDIVDYQFKIMYAK